MRNFFIGLFFILADAGFVLVAVLGIYSLMQLPENTPHLVFAKVCIIMVVLFFSFLAVGMTLMLGEAVSASVWGEEE